MPRLNKSKGSSLLRGLDVESILDVDDAVEAASSTHRVTRQALHGEASEPLYNMKYHPMDDVTRPHRAKRLRGTSTTSDQVMKADCDSGSEQEEDLSGVGSSSEEEHGKEVECLRRRREETTPARRSTRAATQKLVDYDMSRHPQDRQLIKGGVCRPSQRSKPGAGRKSRDVKRDNKHTTTKKGKKHSVRFGKLYVAEDMDVFEQAPGTHYWPDGRDYKLHDATESPTNEIIPINASERKELQQTTIEIEADAGVDDSGVGFSPDFSEDDNELMKDIDDLSEALYTKQNVRGSTTSKVEVAANDPGFGSGIHIPKAESELRDRSGSVIEGDTTTERSPQSNPPESGQEACRQEYANYSLSSTVPPQVDGGTPQPTSESFIEHQTPSSPCLYQQRKSKPCAKEAASKSERTTTFLQTRGDYSESDLRVADNAADYTASDNDQTAFRISLRHHNLATAVNPATYGSLHSRPVSEKTDMRGPFVLKSPAATACRQAELNDTIHAGASSSPTRVGSSQRANASLDQTTQSVDRLSPHYQVPPSRQRDCETASYGIELEPPSNKSLLGRHHDHSMELREPSPHHLAGEALRNGISFHQVVNPISSGDASSQLTGSSLISSQVSVGQVKDLSKRRTRKREQTFTVHEDTQEHAATYAQQVLNCLQNSPCVDYPKENQQAESEAAQETLYPQGTTQQRSEVPEAQLHQSSEASSDGPQNDVDRQIQAEMASVSQSQRLQNRTSAAV